MKISMLTEFFPPNLIIGLPIRYRWIEANQVCSDLELWPKVKKLKTTSNPKLQRIGKFHKTLEGDRSSLKHGWTLYYQKTQTYCYS